jgi:uncharacterized protein YvpB
MQKRDAFRKFAAYLKGPNGKKIWIAATGVFLAAVCLCLTGVIVHRRNTAEIPVAESVTPGTTVTEVTTLPTETQSETATETTTKKPAPKPVGTTKPVERDEPALPQKVTQNTSKNHPIRCLNVPFIDQRKKYPTGCESVAAVMALQYYGMPISVETFIDRYLPKGRAPFMDSTGTRFGDDPRKVFLGNPYSDKGWGCYAPVIVNAVNRYIDKYKYSVKAVYGVSLDALCKQYIDKGVPVLIWATQNMARVKKPTPAHTWTIIGTNETFTWISPMHCLLLVGYDATGYYFNDSLQGKNYRYSKSSVQTAYKAIGMQAVIISDTPALTTTKPAPTTTEPETVTETETVSETETGTSAAETVTASAVAETA